jgi:hypothetical protein
MALDLANRTGFACGIAGEDRPRLEAWILKRPAESYEVATRNLAATLRDNIRIENPDAIVIEDFMNPAAQPSASTIVSQMFFHGAVEAIAGVYGVRTVRPTSSQFRVHFCGQASAAPKRNRPRTKAEQEADRVATNMMVVRRAILLGYLPRGSTDWDKASAAALWDWACATLARRAPTRLVMFGENIHEIEN